MSFNSPSAQLMRPADLDFGQVFYLVDTDYRTQAQGWSKADHTGPLDLLGVTHKNVFYTSGLGISNSYATDAAAMQAKLDELIRAMQGAHNALLDLEELDETEIEHIRRDYRRLADEARQAIRDGRGDTDCDEVAHGGGAP